MIEHGMLYSAPMVLALLDGTKTQTRRPVKPEPGPYWNPTVGLYNPTIITNGGYDAPGPEIFGASDETEGRKFPYGQPGERIWVRETFIAYGRWVTRFSEKKRRDEWHFIDMTAECGHAYQYAADNPDVPLAKKRTGGALPGWYMRPAIFMPRTASRILLEIVSVRAEQLREISQADAIAEGIGMTKVAIDINMTFPAGEAMSICSFRQLWEKINGAGSWRANPWVWAVEFRRLEVDRTVAGPG
ncbi:hypothetical protein [Duganella sp. BJB475]|uniref:hypothetical protein n=1 Tax=Duganella sp. BJB475 TaxID=2233914 RepID=UPI000E34112D|nr:hypothetical protein [Duganella sp. BJB475]RFP19130.1 hypothetical protein D0T23_04930 [Duganella sp. BJB475]